MLPDYPEHNPSTVDAPLLSKLSTIRNRLLAFTMFLSYSIRPLSVSLWTLFITTAQSSPCSLGFPLKSFKTKDVQYLFFQKKEDFVSEQTPFVEDTVDPVFIYKM